MLYSKFEVRRGPVNTFWLELSATSVDQASSQSNGIASGWELAGGGSLPST